MNDERTIRALDRAIELVGNRSTWGQGYYAFDAAGAEVDDWNASAVRFCTIGAMSRSLSDEIPSLTRAEVMSLPVWGILEAVSEQLYGTHTSIVNDNYGQQAALDVLHAVKQLLETSAPVTEKELVTA